MKKTPNQVEQPLGSLGSLDFLTKAAAHEVSRRKMIKASVVAGGLVWSAPVLLSGKAAVAAEDSCCRDGTKITVRVSFDADVAVLAVVGLEVETCLEVKVDSRDLGDLLDCLKLHDLIKCVLEGVFDDTVTITLNAGVTLVAAAVKVDDDPCQFVTCPTFPTCTPPRSNRICVSVGDPTVVTVDISTGLLGAGEAVIDLTLCVDASVSPMCP